jgi:hypothetical protein
LTDLLILVVIALPCLYTYKRGVSQGRLEINHVATFSFGFLFYWITPLVIRLYAERLDFPLASVWLAWFREKLIEPYALSCIALYLCFALGDSLGVRLYNDTLGKQTPKIPRVALSLIALGISGLLIYTVAIFRSMLFRPATPGDVPAQAARGAVTACVVVFCVLALIHTVERPQQGWNKLLRSSYFVLLIAGSILMLWLGSRLYVATFLLMFAVYQSCFRRRFRATRVLALVLILALFFGAVGMWREEGSMSGALFNILEEPILNSISLVHHLRYKGIALVNAPYQLGRDFRNLIPTLILPNKFATSKKPDAYTPLGGLNSFVSFNLNFGLLGSAVFLFLWGILFRYAKSRSSNTVFAIMYIMGSGWLGFSFFRDPFSISLVKAIFQDSIVMPVLVIGFGGLLTAACSSKLGSGPAAHNLQIGTP